MLINPYETNQKKICNIQNRTFTGTKVTKTWLLIRSYSLGTFRNILALKGAREIISLSQNCRKEKKNSSCPKSIKILAREKFVSQCISLSTH